MNNKKLYIIGAGGFGKEVRSMLAATAHSFAGFADDDTGREGVKLSVEELSAAAPNGSYSLAIAIGSSRVRSQVFTRLPSAADFPAIVHPSVIMQEETSVTYGRGSILCAGSIFTCDITMGEFCLVNLNCTIGHDVRMGNFCSLMPAVNLSGNVTLEEGVFIGTGAVVLQGVTIGAHSIIGAGSVVTKDIPPHCTAVGTPARVIKTHG